MQKLEREQGDNSYVWVCGTSGVGKETFIRTMTEDSNSRLSEVFGILEPIATYGPGFEPYSVESLAQLIDRNAIIKWQFRTHKNIARLLALKPNSSHSAVLLWRPYDSQIRDLQDRSTWAVSDSSDTLKFDWKIIERLFRKLQAETRLKVRIVNASTYDYTVIDRWPD